jgi:hypothetical protein
MAAGAQAQARTHSGIHLPRPHVPRPHRVHASKSAYRSVRVRRADGAVMTGYRDSLGTHLRGSDGRTIHCQRQTGGADIEVACR